LEFTKERLERFLEDPRLRVASKTLRDMIKAWFHRNRAARMATPKSIERRTYCFAPAADQQGRARSDAPATRRNILGRKIARVG
jgi:hypothetical protein